MGPWSRGGLLTHHSGGWHGDEEGLRWWFPSPVGCREELLDPDLGSTAAVTCNMFRGKIFWGDRVFSTKGIYRQKGDVRGGPRGPHHLVAQPGGGPRHPMVRPPLGYSPSLLWTPSSCQVNRNFGFCFVQFLEYFLCNFSETQKQQKTGTGTMASC
jgi:hypothetical protein